MKVSTTRLEAFSDGVISIIITIMVLGIKLPSFDEKSSSEIIILNLKHLLPYLLSYAFSFMMIGIFWSNHHYMFHLLEKIDVHLQWLNFLFLFFLSLIPFATALIGSNSFTPVAPALYGTVLFLTSVTFLVMKHYSLRKKLLHTDTSRELTYKIFKVSVMGRKKTIIGSIIYLIAIPLSFINVYAAYICFIIPAILFFIPDAIDNVVLAEKLSEKNS